MSNTVHANPLPEGPSEPALVPPPARGLVSWAWRAVPVALVLGGLAGVAFWGHRTDWTFTRTTAPVAQPAAGGTGGLARVRVGDVLRTKPDIPSTLRREVAIEFDSAGAVDEAGVAIKPAWAGDITDAVEAPSEVGFDPARLTRLGTRAPGVVWRVTKVAGDPVAAGEILALVDAADAGKAKAEFQQALVQVRLRGRTLADLRASGKGVAAQLVREAEAAHADAETRPFGELTDRQHGPPPRAV